MMFNRLRQALVIVSITVISACASGPQATLYDQLGGKQGIEQITARFIAQLADSPEVSSYFQATNLERFYEMFGAHLCAVADGPCTYTGDTMERTHDGMNITETHFNMTVDLLIEAMNQEAIPHRVQNKLLARLAPLRSQVIKR
ncbi:MAG: group 1 truncated hemoglobin [Pseudomonadales bacterium]|nr:group 1 truncated hemoglobin [Pseudomonadales bacterium]